MKSSLYLMLLLVTLVSESFAGTAVRETSAPYQKNPIAFLKKFSQENNFSPDSLYFAVNAYYNSIRSGGAAVSADKEILGFFGENGRIAVYRIDGIQNPKKLIVSAIARKSEHLITNRHYHPVSADYSIEAYLIKSDGTIVAFDTTRDDFSDPSNTDTLLTMKLSLTKLSE